VKRFTLHIPKDIEAELQRCRASIRAAIRKRLQDIVDSLAAQPKPREAALGPSEPPLRFYAFEGYRVSYQVNPVTHKVIVTKIRVERA
jgi:mRNA-degrading endonuclease RelE of RelBE toxin-antitoxin system